MDEWEVKEGFYKLNSFSAAERVREGDFAAVVGACLPQMVIVRYLHFYKQR